MDFSQINWWIFLIPVAWFVFLKLFMLKRINNPNTYEEYLRKLTWVAKITVKDVFILAADEWGLSEKKGLDDFNSYLKSFGKDELPHYVKKFLDAGKPTLDSINVFDYWKIF